MHPAGDGDLHKKDNKHRSGAKRCDGECAGVDLLLVPEPEDRRCGNEDMSVDRSKLRMHRM
jgi:hypothetical protein